MVEFCEFICVFVVVFVADRDSKLIFIGIAFITHFYKDSKFFSPRREYQEIKLFRVNEPNKIGSYVFGI